RLLEHPAAQIVVERRHLTQFRKGKARQEGIGKMSAKHEGQRKIRCPSTALPLSRANLGYVSSPFRLPVPPSATSTSNSVFLPFPTNGCQATTLCLPGGTSLISNVPSSFTTAKWGFETGRKNDCMNSCWSHCRR